MTREFVPFRVVDSEGNVYQLTCSSPHRARGRDEARVLKKVPWFEKGKPTKNWMRVHLENVEDAVAAVVKSEDDIHDETNCGGGPWSSIWSLACHLRG